MTNANLLRRTFLFQACAMTAGTALAASPLLTMPQVPGDQPSDVNRKFYENGTARAFAGNTIISQIPLRTPLSTALTTVRNTLAVQAFSQCLSLLPPSSYHMTVFEGVIDEQRNPPLWPPQVPKDATVQACTDDFTERLKDFDLDDDFKLRMQIDDFNVHKDSGATLHLKPLDAQESRKLHDLRDRLAERLGICAPNHDLYGFHISLGYLVKWMTARQTRDYADVQQNCLAFLRQTFDVIVLDAPRFCTFNDMLAFDDKFAIGKQPDTLPLTDTRT
ncbi:DUF1868 domain-containing protein [Pseudomonas viridiflava]|uniref:DUF1868 domain-containing protein n=1 Tax=Pseudomonas viridiflava TaxID=33069 RepID=UPI0015E2C39A|nr:DUF1868 domain-containing protein [Pseudomonas viridiflava]MBA1229154.1 DUF1868 domain-containing protein [Pseudomonas viridiflava]